MLRPNYLRGGQSLVHLGDLIYVRTRPGRGLADGRETGETRAALVMVSGFARGDASVRLVEDFGRTEVPNAKPSRGKGRPGAPDRAI